MKKFIFLLLISCKLFAQGDGIYTPNTVTGHGYQANRMKPLLVLHIPNIGDTSSLHDYDTSAQIAIYKGIPYFHYHHWQTLGGGGGSQDLQSVTDVGNVINFNHGGDIYNTTIEAGNISFTDSSAQRHTAYSFNGIDFDDLSTGNSTDITFNTPSVSRSQFYPDGDGTLALSVNGVSADNTGNITVPTGSTTLAGLTDVSLTSLAANDFLKYNGTSWINRTPANVKTDLSLNNVENTTLSTWAGTSNITTLGTIVTGVWHGTAIDDTYISSASTWNAKANSGSNTDITSLLLNQTGLTIKGASSNTLTIKPNETLSAGRILNIVTGDATRTLTFTGDASISGTNTGDQTNITGNAGTATALQTTRNIYGNSFNGTADVTSIITSTYLPSSTVYNNQANIYTAGSTQTFTSDATHSGVGFTGVTADPSSLSTGNFWYRSDLNKFRYYDGTIARSLVSEALAQTLTNKTIDASSNTISNIINTNIGSSAAIAYSKLSLSNSIVNADINSSAAIAYSKLSLGSSIQNSDLAGATSIAKGGLNKTSIGTNKFPFSTDGSTYSEGTARQGSEETYTITGSIVQTGTTAASGTLTATYRWSQNLNVVTVRFDFVWVTAGTAITNIQFDFPADLPVPEKPSGLTADANLIGSITGGLFASLTGDPAANSRVGLHALSASSTGYAISVTAGSTNPKGISLLLTYFTASGF